METVFIYFLLLTFSALRVGVRLLEKNLNFRYVSSALYLMTKCGKSGNKAVDNYKNNNFVFTRGRQNVTSESTPSGLSTS